MAEIQAIWWASGSLRLLDQTRLPLEQVVLNLDHYREVVQAIREMRVRGAPALGIAAAYAMAMAARESKGSSRQELIDQLEKASQEIIAARPTAVNMTWAVRRMMRAAQEAANPSEWSARLLAQAQAMQEEDLRINRAIGRHGQSLIPDGGAVLTHCNTGALATAGYGTALGVIRAAWEQGKRFRVFHTETRPFLQGARLTAWELAQLKIPATMVVDSAAGLLLWRREVQCVIVGADRIAANGDTANKIGTYSLAVVARENGVSFYVAAPISTIDLDLASGDAIPIEERDAREVTHIGGQRVAALGVAVRNPAFDVTPHRYIRAIVTEEGVVRPPYEVNLPSVVEGVAARA